MTTIFWQKILITKIYETLAIKCLIIRVLFGSFQISNLRFERLKIAYTGQAAAHKTIRPRLP